MPRIRLDELVVQRGLAPTRAQAKALIMSGRVRRGTERLDKPGKDSWRHREAGAAEVLLISERRWALMHELRDEPEPDLAAQLARMSPCDLVLVEGFKHLGLPKLEIHRPAHGRPLLHLSDPAIVAVATDGALATDLPCLNLNDPAAVAGFIVDHLEL